jgi:hypothetical protein
MAAECWLSGQHALREARTDRLATHVETVLAGAEQQG